MTRSREWEEVRGKLQENIGRLLDRWGLKHEAPGRPPKGMIFPKSPLRYDKHAGSFVIWTEGDMAGAFKDYATNDGHGDVIDLAMAMERLASKADVYVWAREWLGLAPIGHAKPRRKAADREADERRALEAQAAAAKAEAFEAARGRAAFAMWLTCQPITGTPAERYLREARGLPLELLPKAPGALRWSAKCEFIDPETGEVTEYRNVMVAARTLGAKVGGVHLTRLRPDGSGKASVERPKIMLGRSPGSAIRLTTGASGLTPKQAAERGRAGVLAIGEGIETSLTVAIARPRWRVWAAGSLSMMGLIEWPACASEIILLRDNDDNPAAAAAFTRVETAWRGKANGRPLQVAAPHGAKDYNDLLRA